jgi:hypothetical protein
MGPKHPIKILASQAGLFGKSHDILSSHDCIYGPNETSKIVAGKRFVEILRNQGWVAIFLKI